MLLAVDIGNTSVHLGVFEGEELSCTWRIPADEELSSDEYMESLRRLMTSGGIKPSGVEGVMVSSVVPSLDGVLRDVLRDLAGTEPVFLGPHLDTGIRLAVDNPSEVGSDRIANASGAYAIYGTELLVIDFGTAVTFDHVTGSGDFMGGAIAPGMRTWADALSSATARLPRVDVSRPGRVVGRNTVDAIRSGVFYGFVGLVDGLVERIKGEVGGGLKVIATGGLALEVVEEAETVDEVDEFLTLRGLGIIYRRNR